MSGKVLKLATEDEADGLLVTQAIIDLEDKSEITEPVDVARMADEIRNLEVAEDLNEDRDMPNTSDEGDPVPEDSMTDDLGEKSVNEIDPTTPIDEEPDPEEESKEEKETGKAVADLKESEQDVAAVESLMIRVANYELSTEDCKVLHRLGTKYLPQEKDSYALEGLNIGYGVERLKALVAAIWRHIISVVTKIIEMGRVVIDVHNSKLRVAHEDLYEIKKNAAKIRGKSSSQTTIDNAYHKTLMLQEVRSGRDMIITNGMMEKIIKLYFEHVKLNVPIYIESINDFFDQDSVFKDGYVVETNDQGSKTVNIAGTIRITKDTVPGFVRMVNEIPGIKRSFEGAIQLKSGTMPGGLILAVWVAKDSTVRTGQDSEVLRSKMILTQDPSHEIDSTELPVMNYNDLMAYIGSIEKVITALQNGEVYALQYNRSLVDLRRKLVELQRAATVLESDVNSDSLEYIVQYKRRLANAATRIVQVTENFYGTPTRGMMSWGNRYLAYSLKYANAITAAYLIRDTSAKAAKAKAEPSF